MAISPLQDADGVVRLNLLSNGVPLLNTSMLVSAEVRHAAGRVSSARLVFLDGDMPTASFPLSDADTFQPGASIALQAGYGEGVDTIFEGTVVTQGLRLGGDRGSCLVIECRSATVVSTQATGDVIEGMPALTLTHGIDLMSFEADVAATPAPPGRARVQGRMKFQGHAKAVVGSPIELKGVGKRFEGLVPARAVSHSLCEGNWVTEVAFGPSATGATDGDNAGTTVLSDLYGNTVAMHAQGITLASAGDIALKAPGRITLDGVGGVSLASQADVTSSGLNVRCEAQMGFVARGAATAELSSSGQTVVKGVMVMIN